MSKRIVIAGGGAAGFFAAIACAEASPAARIILLEKNARFLSKVRISGGGRCNVTHACFDGRQLSSHYPRGGSALLAPFQLFQPHDTVEWFESRGVQLKTEEDGRIFPVSDSSETVIDCLMHSAKTAGVELLANQGLERVTRRIDGGFDLTLRNEERLVCDRLMLATGGCRSAAAGQLAVSLGHVLEPPVPSLFSFHIAAPWVRDLAGISVPSVELSLIGLRLRERGAVLFTHAGLSGPAILKLSAWGARALHDVDYKFSLHVNWVPHLSAEQVLRKLESQRVLQPSRRVVNSPLPPLAARLWKSLVSLAGMSGEIRWADLSRSARHSLVQQLSRTELQASGKSLNQEEFVTCGGVTLDQVNFRTMESRICPDLYFGGELLDIDGLTGGFNFQSAWTTGWLAGKAMGE